MSAGPDKQPLPNVPLIHRPTDQAASTLKRPPIAVRKRLLVVDDELPILKLVTRILATDNYDVSSAGSGDEAAQMLNAPNYPGVDLLVTDLMMPGLNGRELASVTRNRFPNVRVLYVTGFADTLFKDRHELGEGESFIEKPFGTDGLLEATRLLMFGHISDGQPLPDKRDDVAQWTDERLRAKILRVLRKLRMA
ncbi:MAG TPA: response regulator [Vicinamibacterales bacterium]|nr:response regulator [Vicinamibacterales bacterium]